MKIISECSRQKPVYQIDATISNSQCPHMLPSNNEYLCVIYRPPPPSAIKNEGIHEEYDAYIRQLNEAFEDPAFGKIPERLEKLLKWSKIDGVKDAAEPPRSPHVPMSPEY